MREILFRGKRTDTAEWVYGAYIPRWITGARIHKMILVDRSEYEDMGLGGGEGHNLVYFHCVGDTISQFTGLTDKNGTKIFEGDIVRSKNKPYSFFHIRHGWSREMTYGWILSFEDYKGDYQVDECIKKMEVVGNIFENPELLEGKK